MKRATAERINALARRHLDELTDSIALVREQEPRDVLRNYALAVARLIDTTMEQVLLPLYLRFPDLKPAELNLPGHPSRARPFAATHRLTMPGEAPVEVMLYGADGGVGHTEAQWRAFQASECIMGPYWQLAGKGRWWRDGEDLTDTLRVDALS